MIAYFMFCLEKPSEALYMLTILCGKSKTYFWSSSTSMLYAAIRHEESDPIGGFFRERVKRRFIQGQLSSCCAWTTSGQIKFAQDTIDRCASQAVIGGNFIT